MRDYQKSLEKARELHETSSPEVRSALEKVFTELVEDEGERIRKEMIEILEKEARDFPSSVIAEKSNSWIAWLKKQGKNSMGISEAAKQKLEDNLHEALGKETPESCNEFLDEQSEQKSMKTCAEYYNQDNKLKMPELSEFQNKLADILMYREYDGPDETEDDIAKGRLEYELAAIRLSEELLPLAQKEQKPADKAEQKFEIGDKIIDKSFPKNVFTVTEIIDEGIAYVDKTGERFTKYYDEDDWDEYELVEQKPADKIEFEIGDLITNGKIIGKVDENENNKYHGWFGYDKDLSVHYADIPDIENWHKWTIQDAKPGDVLVDRYGNIGIFEKPFENDWHSYCYLGCNGDFMYDEIGGSHDLVDTYPATKKQRDLLFQKIHEADYEWDDNKKELKKTGEKSAWSKEMGSLCLDALGLLRDYKEGVDPKSQLGVKIERASAFLTDLYHEAFYPNTYNPRPDLKLTTWGEEDERNASYICAALDAYYRLREEKNNTSGQEKLDAARAWINNRLKSLMPKEFNPYNKIWTEKDDKFFEELHKEFRKGYKDASIEQLKDIYSRRLQWLESIRSRLT